MIERRGGIAIVAPAMREVPLEDNHAALDFAERLLAGEFDVVIFLTGVGTRALFEGWRRGIRARRLSPRSRRPQPSRAAQSRSARCASSG